MFTNGKEIKRAALSITIGEMLDKESPLPEEIKEWLKTNLSKLDFDCSLSELSVAKLLEFQLPKELKRELKSLAFYFRRVT